MTVHGKALDESVEMVVAQGDVVKDTSKDLLLDLRQRERGDRLEVAGAPGGRGIVSEGLVELAAVCLAQARQGDEGPPPQVVVDGEAVQPAVVQLAQTGRRRRHGLSAEQA